MLKNRHITSAWSRPTGRFIMKAATFMVLFLGVYRDDLLGRLLDPCTELTARATFFLLHFLNVEAVRLGSQIYHPAGFAYEIYYRCTAVLPSALLAALTFATPASLRCKLIGLCVGVSAMVALNLIRLAHLFHIGVFNPDLFDLAHGLIWEIILVSGTLGIWWIWSRWAASKNPPAPSERKWDGDVRSVRSPVDRRGTGHDERAEEPRGDSVLPG
jgi:exosortase/archaeosortase family protein